MTDPKVERIAGGVYRVEQDGRQETVYVAGTGQDRWAHWNGHVFHEVLAAEPSDRPAARGRGAAIAQPLTAPMPATVIKILVAPGAAVKKGDTMIVLEAMKMELPLRAPADATVTAVHCREGELVEADQALIDLKTL